MNGLTLPNLSGNLPAYIEDITLNRAASADITPKSKRDPFKKPIKYNRLTVGNIPKATP